MRRGYLIAVLLCAAEACALAATLPRTCRGSRRADPFAAVAAPTLQPPTPAPVPTQGQEPAAAEPVSPSPEPATPELCRSQPPLAAAPDLADPVVAIMRSKLGDPTLRKGANPDDLAALEAFYAARGGGPVWVTDMGFSARGQAAIFEIAKADDWGLRASSFELPSCRRSAGQQRRRGSC